MYWKKKRISGLDFAVTVFLLGLAGFIAYRLTVTLNYKWQWDIIPTYLLRFDQEQNKWVANLLLEGLFTTIRLSIWATLLASLLGLFMGLMRSSSRLLYRLIAGTYVELIRNTPPLVLVFIFYFFVSSQILPLLGVEKFISSLPEPAVKWLTFLLSSPSLFTAFLSGVLTIALFQGAYITEIVRAGIESVEKGQWEASYALGLSRFQQMVYIILPQAGRRVLPPLANEFINTIKYSSIVSIISIQELTFQGLQIMAATQVIIEVWVTITIMYLFFCLLLSLVVRHLENRFARANN
jgi:polar amino acid transport system permease protein